MDVIDIIRHFGLRFEVWPGPQHALFNPAPGAPRPIARWAELKVSKHVARLRLEGNMNYLHCLEAS